MTFIAFSGLPGTAASIQGVAVREPGRTHGRWPWLAGLVRELLLAAVLIAIALANAGHALAEKRHALVIGINNYESLPDLERAVGDADALSAALASAGYSVRRVIDPTRRAINRAINQLVRDITPGDVVLFHFSGHGVRISGQNYLLPADTPVPEYGQADFIASESIRLGSIVDRLAATGAKVRLFIIDACRDNPFPQKGTRSLNFGRGLGRIEPPEGNFMMLSAGIGQQALDQLGPDDKVGTSVFMRVFLSELAKRETSLLQMSVNVRRTVSELARTIGHEQRPASYDGLNASDRFSILGGAFVPSGGAQPGSGKVVTAPVAPPNAEANGRSQPSAPGLSEKEAYEIANDVDTADAWERYLEAFPTGFRADLVRLRLAKLRAVAQQAEQQEAAARKHDKVAVVSPPAVKPKPIAEKDCGHPHGDWKVVASHLKGPAELRVSPASKAKVAHYIPKTATGAERIACEAGWCKIRYKCSEGWLPKSFLVNAKTGPVLIPGVEYYQVKGGGLPIRNGAGRNHRMITRIPAGTKHIRVVQCSSNRHPNGDLWCIIQYTPSAQGWGRADLLASMKTGAPPR